MSIVYMRRAQNSDLSEIKHIIDGARKYLKKQGIDQWQSGYPDEEIIKKDIDNSEGFVLIVDHHVAGYAAVIIGEDLAYRFIEEGAWLNASIEYATIHRFALSENYRGQKLSQRFMTAVLTYFNTLQINDFRIDTHPENISMRRVIKSNGFSKQGIIHVDEKQAINNLRWAYQLVLR